MTPREGPGRTRFLGILSRSVSGAILFREAARTSRRWQTYGARVLFTGVLAGVVLIGLRFAYDASRSAGLDAAQLGQIGDTLFTVFCVVQLGLAMVLAPLTTAAAIAEERTDRTFDLLVLTGLRPGQIFGGKVLSRILVLLTVVLGALPILALVVNFGGVSTTEVVVLTGHTLVNVVLVGILGAFFGLFTRSPLLAMMASTIYAIPFFVLLPFGYAAVMGSPESVTHFSTLSAFAATDLWGLLPAIGFIPTVVLTLRLAAPLFELQVSRASFEFSLSDDIWRVGRGVAAFVAWGGVAVLTFPFAGAYAWNVSAGNVTWAWSVDSALHVFAVTWVFGMFSILMAIGTWGFLRVAVDVVDGIDGIFTRPVVGSRARRSRSLGTWPVWWREARPSAWGSSAAPILVTWGLVLLAIFQTGAWLAPGMLLVMGIGNTVGVYVLTAWLASRSIVEERRNGTLEVLLATTIGTPQIVLGKAAGAALPTLPIMFVGLPMFAFGWAYVDLVQQMYEPQSFLRPGAMFDGMVMWAWAVPPWACLAVASMSAAARLRRPQNAFGLTMVAFVALLGWTPLVGRLAPDLPIVADLARLIAPPLAGGASDGLHVVSMVSWSLLALFGIVVLSRRLRPWIGAVAALTAVGLLSSAPALAQPTPDDIASLERTFGIRVRAVPLADGLSRDGRWTHVRVAVENAGPPVKGVLRWTEPTTSGERPVVRPLEIPEKGRKVVDLPVFRGGSPAVGGLWFDAGIRQGAARVQFVPTAEEDVNIGVIGRDPLGLPAAIPDAWPGDVPGRLALPYVADASETVRAVRTGLVPIETMPSFAAGYDALDWVVWPSADPTRLRPDQLRALLDWVADGGHLLVTITDTWRSVADSPLGEALPVTLQGVAETELAPLAARLDDRRRTVSGVAPTVRSVLRADRASYGRAWSDDGRPLWAIGTFGTGTLHVVLANPAVEPLARVDRRQMWRHLLHLPAPGATTLDLGPDSTHWEELRSALHLQRAPSLPGEQDLWEAPHEWAERPIRERLSDIPNLSPLPIEWLALFGVLYLLWIGPVDWLVLRLIGRQTWTWVTFPIVIVGFSTFALVGAAQQKGSQAMLLRVERIDVLPDANRLRGDTWLGLFSTRKGTLTLGSTRQDAVIQPLTEPGFMTDPGFSTGGGPVDLTYGAETWTFGYSRSRWMDEATGTVDVTWFGGQPAGVPSTSPERARVTHDLPVDFDDAALVSPEGQLVFLGALPRGEVWEGPLAEGAERRSDDLDWVEGISFDLAARRGALRTSGRWTFVGTTRTAVDPIRVSGLSPRIMPLTVFRQVLPQPVRGRSRPIFRATFRPLDAARHARLVCRDQTSAVLVRGGQARIPLPPSVAPDDPGCRLEIAPPLAGWRSGVPVSIDRPNQCTVTDRDVVCESTR